MHQIRLYFIDKEDYDKVKYFLVYIDRKYVYCEKDGKNTRIHRFLTSTTDPKIYVDHIDSNPFNNIKSNLRLSNQVKNGRNKKKQKTAFLII